MVTITAQFRVVTIETRTIEITEEEFAECNNEQLTISGKAWCSPKAAVVETTNDIDDEATIVRRANGDIIWAYCPQCGDGSTTGCPYHFWEDTK